jgi:glycosyltransferase involved in cell wall biosynthesis
MTPWLLATGDFTTSGGMDRANYALASYLARRGHPVYLVAHRIDPGLTSLPAVHSQLVPRPLGAHLAGAPLLARSASRQAHALDPGARVLMNGGNGAIGAPVWIHYLHAAYVPHIRASLRARVSGSIGRRYYLSRERRAIRNAPLVICNSERTQRDVRERYSVPAARTRVVYYGSDPAAFGPVSPAERRTAREALAIADGRLAAVFIGALGDRRKAFDVVFDAWRTLLGDSGWDVDLLVAGAGSEAAAWEQRVRAAGIGGRVRLLGFRDDVPRVLAAADVLVHPARYEAYGLSVHEALCRGVPAIVPASAGVAEKYPKALGSLLLQDPTGADGIVSALRAWRGNVDEWRARVGAAGCALRARTWDDMAEEIVAAVEAVA